MGADRSPAELACGVIRAAEKLPLHLVLAARQEDLPPDLPSTVEVIECSEEPGGGGSIARGIDAVRTGNAQAFLSPGSTGAVVRAAVLRLGRLPGVLRPGLCASLPTLRGEVLLIDAGATADPKPEHLAQFAKLGRAYAQGILGIPRPTVGLLNIGTEEGKGDRLTRAAHDLLLTAEGFVGNVEPHTLLAERPADVVVCGGFAGNLLLKTAEGGTEALLAMLKEALRRSPRTKLGAWLAQSAFRSVGKRLRYEEHNAAPLLGVNGLVLIAHGRSDAQAMGGALRRAFLACQAGIVEALRSRSAPPGLANPGDPRVPSATPTQAG